MPDGAFAVSCSALLIKIPQVRLDGYPDSARSNTLYSNERRGRFENITRQVGLEVGHQHGGSFPWISGQFSSY